MTRCGNVQEEYGPHNIHHAIRLPGLHYDRKTGLNDNRHRCYMLGMSTRRLRSIHGSRPVLVRAVLLDLMHPRSPIHSYSSTPSPRLSNARKRCSIDRSERSLCPSRVNQSLASASNCSCKAFEPAADSLDKLVKQLIKNVWSSVMVRGFLVCGMSDLGLRCGLGGRRVWPWH